MLTSIPLDRPCEESIKLKDIYKIEYPSLKNKCTDVSEFNIGNFQYYKDPNKNALMYNQLLIGKSNIIDCNTVNPLGVKENSKTIVQETLNKNNLSDYQYHKDDLSRREEMMLSALNKIKKYDYMG